MEKATIRAGLLALALPALMISPVHADTCETAEDQATLNQCTQQSYQEIDGQLNAMYHQIRQRIGDNPEAQALFRDAERRWIDFRDAECDFAASGVAGGSIYPMIHNTCLAELTSQRVERFEQYLSCEEGDMSCPVPWADSDLSIGAAGPFGFTVTLSFSARALETLSSLNERVIVAASYSGEPTPEGVAHADEIGQINLGSELVETPAADGPVEVTGSGVLPEMLQWARDGSIAVNVNVFTARLSNEDNLISCDIVDGPLADVRAAAMPIPLACSLIEENPETAVKP